MHANNSQLKSEYYMPSANSLKNNGPTQCTFSSPKVTYSKETEDFVKLLMTETKLTTMQRQGFQAILRSSDSAHESTSTALSRRKEYLRRRSAKVKAMGLDISSAAAGMNAYKFKHGSGFGMRGGKRTLDTIQATGVFDTPTLTRTYVPVNKEAEKVRLAYKMAYGQEPSQDMMDRMMNKPSVDSKFDSRHVSEKSIIDINQERFNELVEEIQERVEFLESMKIVNRDKQYHSYIICQIREKLNEVKSLFPQRVNDIVRNLRLDAIDRLFAKVT